MSKTVEYLDGHALRDLIKMAIAEDEGSRTRDHRYLTEEQRLWLLRESKFNSRTRFIECFEFIESQAGDWGLCSWSEEEDIPYFDCPLELLTMANCAVNIAWRDVVMESQARSYALPPGAWLHSPNGLMLPSGAICHDFKFVTGDIFSCPDGATLHLPPETVIQMARDGMGIASGRA